MEIQPPRSLKMDMTVPTKIMMAAGPSNCSQRVLNVLNKPVLGHLHTELLKIMDDVKDGIRYMFQTRNPLTFCVSASGHGGMETVLCNLLEDGDVILIAITGIWGQRAAEMAKRYGADVRELPTHYGSGLTVDEVRDAMIAHNPMAFFVVQGDSSTGIYQPLEEFGELCRKFSCLFIVDTVASLGGVELHADKWQIDAIYTGSQKVLGAPPGLTPISFSAKSIQRMAGRNSKVKCFYFDAMLLGDYWGCFGRPRFYHHTISATLLYGLREALTQVCEQGLESVIKRHQDCSLRLQKGLEDMGLEMFVPNPNYRLPTVNTIKVPEGVEWTRIVTYVLRKYSLEIGGGLGPTVGTVFRIGLMGENATFEKVDFVLKAFKEAIQNTSKFQLKNEKSKI